jgi:thiol-disulfide isomerase/thioredoxin
MNFKNEFEKALIVDDYIKLLGDQKALHDLHYKKAEIKETIKEDKKINLLAITEPWCGDSTAILPVIIKFFEKGNAEIKIALRDQNIDLIDKFKTRGGKAIPIILVLDENFNLIMQFGPRPVKAQQIYEDNREYIETGKIEKQVIMRKIRTFYSKDKGKTILEEFVDELKKYLPLKQQQEEFLV